ncbi:MAG: iron-sulfur cluster insertion protein ErpA [Alphaproteobacteria bacterium]|nr:iron-sulfur cluster insertion protein ErpA [Alphaproteobacteria bacterium]
MSEPQTETLTMSITGNCAKRILAMREKENNPKLMLRVTVLGGGCSGFQYDLDWDDKLNPDDVTFEKDGAVLVTDETSLPFLNNAEVDYVQEMIKSAFKIKNPNAAASCGCGNSFAPKT